MLQPFENSFKEIEIVSALQTSARQQAADFIAGGKVVGMYIHSVCALLGKGDDTSLFEEVIRVKGEKRRTQPLAIVKSYQGIVELLDTAKIPASLHPIFQNPAEFTARFGSICFFRLPLKRQTISQVPAHLLSYTPDSTPVMMLLDPTGNPLLGRVDPGSRSQRGEIFFWKLHEL